MLVNLYCGTLIFFLPITPLLAVYPLKLWSFHFKMCRSNLLQSQCRYKTIMSLCKHVHIFIFFSQSLLPSSMKEVMMWIGQVLLQILVFSFLII